MGNGGKKAKKDGIRASNAEFKEFKKSGAAAAVPYQVPGLLINIIQSECPLRIAPFLMLSDTFQECYARCCSQFQISPDEAAKETAEHRAAITYSILKLLFEIGYSTEKTVVSGLDTLMILAAKDAIKLENACLLWKTVAESWMSGRKQEDIVQRIKTVLKKFPINYQKTVSLISIHGLSLSDPEPIAQAILTDDEQNRRFLNSRMEPYMVFGSVNHLSNKQIQTPQDFLQFFISQEDPRLLEAWQKFLIQEKAAVKKNFKNNPSSLCSSPGFNDRNCPKDFALQIHLKQEKYLFSHSISNCNILSAATLLTRINSVLAKCQIILEDVTFLFPVVFKPETEVLDFKIEISAQKCTVINVNRQCVTFRIGEFCFLEDSEIQGTESENAHAKSSDTEPPRHGIRNAERDAIEKKFISEEEFYAQMEKCCYHYSEEFRSVKNLTILTGTDMGNAELKSSEHLDTLIDGAMQAIVFIFIQRHVGSKFNTTLVPFHIQKLQFLKEEQKITPVEKNSSRQRNSNVLATCKAEFQNGQLSGSFKFTYSKVSFEVQGITFYPLQPHIIQRSLSKERETTVDSIKSTESHSQPNAEIEEIVSRSNGIPKALDTSGSNQASESEKSIYIKSIACRLPETICDSAELWDALKSGQIMVNKIPCSRIQQRDRLAQGQFGHAVKCSHFLAHDIAYFDAGFFGISRSEAEKMDPQQRLLLECVYECMENAGRTSLKDTGFFIGFMANEYPEIVRSQDVVSMLGSSASIVSGRLNYVFGSTGPAITLDTACSSSLVALQAAIQALRQGQCTTAIVGGVNLILTEQSIAKRANGNLLAEDGICRSFDCCASGYGRADGCVVLLLGIVTKDVVDILDNNSGSASTVENCMVTVASSSMGHNGRSASLTTPSGTSQEKLLKECLSRIPSTANVDYWETHGTGTIIGDAIELKSLQANLRSCLISTIKTHFGHPEAAAGAAGLAKLWLQFQHHYIPEHGSYQFLENFQNGAVYLPVVGQEWLSRLAGLSSFGISGTNAMTVLCCKETRGIPKRFPEPTKKWFQQIYICPISAKSRDSLRMLMRAYLEILENSPWGAENICSAAALQRNHMHYRAIVILQKFGNTAQKNQTLEGKPRRLRLALELFSSSCLQAFSWLFSMFPRFRTNFKAYFQLVKNFTQQNHTILRRVQNIFTLTTHLAFIKFLHDLGIELHAILAHDRLALTAALLSSGKLKFAGSPTASLSMKFSKMLIFTEKTMPHNFDSQHRSSKYYWYNPGHSGDQQKFEHELMMLIGTAYLLGKNINWTCLYLPPCQHITLPNYQFNREELWITGRPRTIEHWLVGRLLEDDGNEFVFENQISRMTNMALLAFNYDGKVRFSVGICCEAIISAVRLIAPKGAKDSIYILKQLTVIKFSVQENIWIKTRIRKDADNEYYVKMTCGAEVICAAKIELNDRKTAAKKVLNTAEIENLITNTGFYDHLKSEGLVYDGDYQTVVSSSPNGLFLAKWCCETYLILETLLQVACYVGTLNPRDIYAGNNFTIRNLKLYPICSRNVHVRIENSRILAYSEAGLRIANVDLEKPIPPKKTKPEYPEENVKISSRQDQLQQHSGNFQKWINKVKQAVEDIRNDSTALNNNQLSVSFTALGLDSLAITDLANRLSTVYFPGLQIGPVDLFNFPSILTLAEAIYSNRISIRNVSKKENRQEESPERAFDTTIWTSKVTTGKEDANNNQDNHVNVTYEVDESCVYVQTYLKRNQTKNRGITAVITDKVRKPDKGILLIVVSRTVPGSNYQKGNGILYLDFRNPETFEERLRSQLSKHRVVTIRFELSSAYQLRYLVEVLLLLTKIISNSKLTYIFSSMPGCGRVNAYALGFAKSLSAELYPKVQYEWDFCLRKVANLKENYPITPPKSRKQPKERWLITGGLGGIGWEMAKMILQVRNVSHMILLARRQPDDGKRHEINKFCEQGIDVRAVSVDLTSRKQVTEFFTGLRISLTGVIHSAGCVHDALAAEQSVGTFREAAEAKCDGLLMLVNLCSRGHHPIKHFIVNSSISALIGNRGQCNYSSANAFADEFILKQRTRGLLPATVINWGNWLETGMAKPVNKVLQKMGFDGLRTETALTYLQYAIDHKPSRMIVMRLDARKIRRYRPDLTTVFPESVPQLIENQNACSDCSTYKTGGDAVKLTNTVKECHIEEQPDNYGKFLEKRVVQSNSDALDKPIIQGGKGCDASSNVFHRSNKRIKSEIIQAAEEVSGKRVTPKDFRKSFVDLGFDSLKIYQLVSALSQKIETTPRLTILAVFENPTIEQLAQYIESLSYSIRKGYPTDEGSRLPKEQADISGANNFLLFSLHAEDKKQLKDKKRRCLELLENSYANPEILVEQLCEPKLGNGYLHIVWGTGRRALMKSLLRSKIVPNFGHPENRTICFMFSGQGSQTWNMGRQLSCIFPFFRKLYDRTILAASKYMPNQDLRDVIHCWSSRQLLYKTEYAQPIIYCFAYSLAKFYERCGVKANVFVGHSIGELVALTLAGRISLNDALKLVVQRGQILGCIKGKGKMIAVKRSDAAVLQRYSGMSCAAENSDKQIILSGDNRSARRCLHFARVHGYPITVIDESYPFHSSVIDDSLTERYMIASKQVKFRKMDRKNMIRNCTGRFLDDSIRISVAPINSTVRFRECIKTLHSSGTNIWLEIGGREILSPMVRNTIVPTNQNVLICSAAKNGMQEVASFVDSLCQLQKFGVRVKWSEVCNMDGFWESLPENCPIDYPLQSAEEYENLTDQHLINGQIAVPAAVIIALFAEFLGDSPSTTDIRPSQRYKLLERRPLFRSHMADRREVIIEKLRLEKRLSEIVSAKLCVKTRNSGLVLADDVNIYSHCEINSETGKVPATQQMKSVVFLEKFHNHYDQLKVKMNKLSHQLFYETMRKRGLQYGPKYDILRDIRRKGRCVCATLASVGHLIGLLDGALQALSAAVLTTVSSSIYVPFLIDRILIRPSKKVADCHYQVFGIVSERRDNLIRGSAIVCQDREEIIILENVAAVDINSIEALSVEQRDPKRFLGPQPDDHPELPTNNAETCSRQKNKSVKEVEKQMTNNSKSHNVNMPEAKTVDSRRPKNFKGQNQPLRIEILSYTGLFPGSAVDSVSLWNNLKSGTDSIHEPRSIIKMLNADVAAFDPAKFGITPKEAVYMDPQQRILLELAQKTMEKAGLESLDPSTTGVFIGVSSSDFAQKAYEEIQEISPHLSTGTNQSALAGRIAFWLNLSGPALVVDTACSSFFAALVVACDSIKLGHCRTALVGAVNLILNSKTTSVLDQAQMLSKTGCSKIFDVDADGYVRSEAAAMILIKGISGGSDSRSRIRKSAGYPNNMRFTIESYTIGHNGRSSGLTIPNGLNESQLMSQAIQNSGSYGIRWVEAHATGTALGDPIEMSAIVEALENGPRRSNNGGHYVHVTSVKSSLGHCEAAAGVASLIMILEAFRNRYLPPMQHFKLLNRNISENAAAVKAVVPVIGEELEPTTVDVLINSFGFSGTNVSAVIRGGTIAQQSEEKAKPFRNSLYILVCSGKSSAALEAMSEKLQDFLQTTNQNLADVCASLQKLQNLGEYRMAIPVKRHTQKSAFPTMCKSRKWTKIAFIMTSTPLNPVVIAELCSSYRSFKKIFLKYIRIYRCTSSFAAPNPSGRFEFEFIAKLSVITFLDSLGVKPSAVFAKTQVDRIVAQVFRRRSRTKRSFLKAAQSSSMVPCLHRDFELRQDIGSDDDFDCFIDVQNFRIGKPETADTSSDWKKRSFSSSFVDTICQLCEHSVDINWEVLTDDDEISGTCAVPEPESCRKSYWPFVGSSTRNRHKGANAFPEHEIPHTVLDIKGTKSAEHPINSITTDQANSHFEYHQYLYKIVHEKCQNLPNPEQITPFVAVNLTDTTAIHGQLACFLGKINKDEDIADLKKQLCVHKCRKILLQWIVDEDTLLESSIAQSMGVIKLWILLEEMWNGVDHKNQNPKPCLIVFATDFKTNVKQNQRFTPPYSALLKTLAAERGRVNFKSILADGNDPEHILREICDENFLNEVICYSDGNRYLERLQKLDELDCASVLQQTPPDNVHRILVTGSPSGIAGELIKVIKPQMAVIASRSVPVSEKRRHGTLIKTVQADCTDYDQMERIFTTFAPFDVVFHCAATVSNAPVDRMDRERFETVCRPKLLGLQNIIRLSKLCEIRKVLAFSSAATVFGSAGQANYVLANQFVEHLMRRSDVPNALTISWGPWYGRGLLAGKQMDRIRKQIRNTGWKLLHPTGVAQLCCRMLRSATGHYVAMDVDFAVFRKKRPYLRTFLEHITENKVYQYDLKTRSKQKCSSCKMDKQKISACSEADIKEFIQNCITEVSGIQDARTDVGFMSMGIDSLMLAEMREMLNERYLNLNISIATLYEQCTVETLARYVAQTMPMNLGNSEVCIDVGHIAEADDVAITGYSGAFSGSPDDQTFWSSLLDGKELTEPCSGGKTGGALGLVPDTDKFDYRFWKMSHSDACYIDPQIRKFVEHAYVALERSGLVRCRNKLRIAVVAAAEPSGYYPQARSHVNGLEGLYELNQKDFVASWTSHLLNLRGPSFGVYSACSSALVAIVEAANLLHDNRCDAALAGAVSLVIPDDLRDTASQTGMILSPDGHCRPFDHKSNGTVRGSAVGVVVLRRLQEAGQNVGPIILKIAGYGVSNDGLQKSSFMAPNIGGQRECIQEANQMAGASEVDFIECHGTGTATGDLIELTAMSQLYRKDTLIGSVKANIGHALAGAGIASIIKLCKIAETRLVPKQANFEKLSENLKDVSFRIPRNNVELPEDKMLRFAVNACGIGGTNAHVILESIDMHRKSQPENKENPEFYALIISGRTEDSCLRLCHRIADYLKQEAAVNLGEVASTLQYYREHFEYRTAITSRTTVDAICQLKNKSMVHQRIQELRPENVAFYFTPQGLEYSNMGKEAMIRNKIFRKIIRKCCSIASKLIGQDFEDIIYPKQKSDAQQMILEQPYSQMATFIVCFSLAEQLQAWGIQACTMLGHSLGEYVAAAQSGVFDLETALRIILERGRLIARTEKAKMLAVKSTTGICKVPETAEVSAVLGPDLKCVVAKPSAIEELKGKLAQEGVQYRELITSYGFHSSFMEPILEEFAQFLQNFSFKKPTKQILSNIDGQPIERFDHDYMVKHMRSTIRIDKCIKNLHNEIKVIVEIGPKGILESLLKDDERGISVISTLPSSKKYQQGQDTGDLLEVATKLWAKGYDLDWEMVCGNHGFDSSLPNYQFEKDICWEHRKKRQPPDFQQQREVNLYQPCWVSCVSGPGRQFPKGVLLFAPKIFTETICAFLITLHNLFIPVQCVFDGISPKKNHDNMEITDTGIYIDGTTETTYQILASRLREQDFSFDTVIHAWNITPNQDICCFNKSALFSSFYSIHWIIATIMPDMTDNLKFLVAIDWEASPETFTVLGPLRELDMANSTGLVRAGCILCTPGVDLFEALQMLKIQEVDFSLIRGSVNGAGFEHLSYQQKSIWQLHSLQDQDQSDTDCLIRNGDLVVIFGGFGTIGQSFINVLSQNFHSITVCVASREAIRHFQEFQDKIIGWEAAGNHKIHAYNVDITNFLEVRHFLDKILEHYQRINLIIHAAGKVNDKYEKGFREIEHVLQPKIHGIRNVIDVLQQNNIKIRGLILNSSLNALLGLPGNSDYAASNIFLDELSQRQLCNIQNIITIQWSGWRDSNMLKKYHEKNWRNPLAKFIMENSLSVPEAEQMIRKCLWERKSAAIAMANPVEIFKEIYKITHNSKSPGRHVKLGIPGKHQFEKNEENDIRNTTADKRIEDSGLPRIIADIWKSCLGAEQTITPDDDFFQLGGHSLNGMQIIWDINRVINISCKLDDLFQNPRFGNFLNFLLQQQGQNISGSWQKPFTNQKSFKILNDSGQLKKIPLSYSQENMYILRQLQNPTLYNICFLITFQGSLCTKSLRKALLYVIAKQSALRTAFPLSGNGECYQEIHSLTESYYQINWPFKSELERQKLIGDEKNCEMDLREIPFRIIAMQIAVKAGEKPEYGILISQHHIITDGWSVTVFADELSQFYQYCLEQQPIPENQKKLRANVAHFAIWQRGENFSKNMQEGIQQLCSRLEGIQATRIIAHKKTVETITSSAPISKQEVFPIPAPLWERIIRTAKESHQTVYTVMLAAFICLVRKFSNDYAGSNNPTVIGCPVSGRTVPEMKSVVGYFLNNMILVVNGLKIGPLLLEQVAEAVQEARRFEHVPFHLLVAKLAQRQRQNPGIHPIFDIFFNYRHNLDFPRINIAGLQSTVTQLTNNNAFNFSCTIDETDRGALVTFDYEANLYSFEQITGLFRSYLKLLISIVIPQHGSKTDAVSCGVRLDVPSTKSLISAISYQSGITDQSSALNFPQQSVITYEEMHRAMHSFAAQIEQFYLQCNCECLRADTILPICADSKAIVIPLLAVQSIGAAYAPIDPRNSSQVIAQLVHETGSSIAVIQEGYDLSSLNVPVLPFSEFDSSPDSKFCPAESGIFRFTETHRKTGKKKMKVFRSRSQPCDAAYVIFTSGSTGKPKAVCVANRNLLSFVVSSSRQTCLRPAVRVYHSVNTTSDVSCVNIFTTLTNGGCLIGARNVLNAGTEIIQNSVQFAFLPSALFNMFQAQEIQQLRHVENLYVGGETPHTEQLNRCLKGGIRIRQIYGPTETTIWSLTNSCSILESESGRIIGKPMDNESAWLLDQENGITWDGAVGELVICGDGVSRGYLNQETDAFTLNEFQRSREDKILNRNMLSYRTGDLAIRRAGKYLFLGRKDKQLKIRGYRLELAEIEAAVRAWDPSIQNIVILKNEKTENLVLFVENENPYCCSELRGFLRKRLLHFMIPGQIVVLQRMPLNASGKIDLNKLKRSVDTENSTPHKVFAGNPQEKEILTGKVHEIWGQLLGITGFGPDEDFFNLGGHSLLLVLLRNKIRERFGFELDIEQFYRHPTLAALIDDMLPETNMDKEEAVGIYRNHSVPSPCISLIEERPLRFMALREISADAGNLYMIHAIAGSVYAYFGIISAIPECLNIYAIEYELHYPSNNLIELASFYRKYIVKHSKTSAIYLMGHSLGGILAREIAQLIVEENKEVVQPPPFVIMLDSWAIGISNLRVNTVKEYLQQKLEGLPSKEQYIEQSIQLTQMLQKHQFSINPIKIYLLKAKSLGNSALRTSLSGSNSTDEVRSIMTNGWQKISRKSVEVFLVDGDHDSILRQQNIPNLIRIFAQIYAQNGLKITQI